MINIHKNSFSDDLFCAVSFGGGGGGGSYGTAQDDYVGNHIDRNTPGDLTHDQYGNPGSTTTNVIIPLKKNSTLHYQNVSSTLVATPVQTT